MHPHGLNRCHLKTLLSLIHLESQNGTGLAGWESLSCTSSLPSGAVRPTTPTLQARA